jgi:hypothetical protein
MTENEKKTFTPITALRAFFGYRPGQGLKDFADEVKHLSEEEKIELAKLACAEMGAELTIKGE